MTEEQIAALIHAVAPNFPGTALTVIEAVVRYLPDLVHMIEKHEHHRINAAIDAAKIRVDAAFDAREPKS